MNWFYEENGGQVGPVTEDKLRDLIREGRVVPSTLVWREGFTEWKALSQVGLDSKPSATPAPLDQAQPDGTAGASTVCYICGKAAAAEDLIQISKRVVCAQCKPVFLQRLREGVLFPGAPVFASFWLRFAAKVIDAIIDQVVGYSIMGLAGLLIFGTARVVISQPDTVSDRDYMLFAIAGFIFPTIISAAWQAWMLSRWGATPGKLLCGLRVVRSDGSRLTFWRAFGRCFGEIVSALLCLIGYFMAAFDAEKRTLHDRMCDTRVVAKS